jgi:SAM-dependent methyltransferase
LQLNRVQQQAKQQVEYKVQNQEYVFEDVACPLCANSELQKLAEQDRYGLSMTVKICINCGLILTSPRMTQQSYNKFYNAEYRPLYEGEDNATHRSFQLQYNRGAGIVGYIQRFLPKPPEETLVLEVGCGSGGVLAAFRQQGYRVKGIDLGEEHLKYGVKQHNLDLTVGTLADLELSIAPDLVVYSHVFEHILDLATELELANQVLSDEGCLFIEVPGVKFIQFSYGSDFLRLLQNAHTFHFSLQSLTNVLLRNGFAKVAGNESIQALFRPMSKLKHEESAMCNDYGAAMAFLEEVEAEFQLMQGIELFNAARYVDAAIRFAELTALKPSDPLTYKLFAKSLDHLGKTKEAQQIRQAALTL